MKQFIYSLAVATTLLSTVSCDDNEIIDTPIPDSQKEMISFSLSDGTSQTRAGFRGSPTFIAMRIQSDKRVDSGSPTDVKYTRTTATANKEASGKDFSTITFTDDQKRYWDDAHGRYSLLSVYAVAIPNSATDIKTLESKLNKGDETNKWGTNSSNTIQWSVTTDAQTKDANAENSSSVTGSSGTIDQEDLVYSHNIKNGGFNGIYRYNFASSQYEPEESGGSNHKSGRMLFYQNGQVIDNPSVANSAVTDASGKFDKGHLVFNHALTRLTVNLKRGIGFASGSSYFKFADGTNITLKSVPTEGKLDLAAGTWSSDGITQPKNDIAKMAKLASNTGFDHSLMAQFIPGYTFTDGSSTNVMEFTIDDNTYYITQDMVFDALKAKAGTGEGKNGLATDATSYTMEQGKNYVLDITVNKTGIESVTATLIGWADVLSDNIDATNSYITISTETMGAQTNACNHFDLYRLDAGVNVIYTEGSVPQKTNWGGNYNQQAASLSETSTSGVWKTEWFWESNKSFYHFRTVDKGMTLFDTDNNTDDNFKIFSGPVKDEFTNGDISTAINDKKYNDYHWGAPMKRGASLTYNPTPNTESVKNEGYSESLYYAIGSTTDQINIIEQHMMATVHFVLHTGKKADGTDVSSAAVSLLGTSSNGTRLTLTNFAGEGTVKVGNGFILPSNTLISSDIPVPGASSTDYTSNNNLYTLSSLATTSGSFFKTASSETNTYNYRLVPQTLYRGSESNIENETDLTKFIGLTIVTPDDNQYYVIKMLYGVQGKITSNGNKTEHGTTNSTAAITHWYPGYDYTYHIYINKTGIESVTCSVVEWAKVEGNIGDINLEN